MRKINIILFFILSALALGFATLPPPPPGMNMDSLFREIDVQKPLYADEIKLYHDLAVYYAAYDMERTYELSMRALKLAEKEKDRYHIAHFNSVIASTYIYRSSYDTAFVYLDKALGITKEIKNREKESVIYISIANIYARQGMFAQAVEYYMKVLDLYEHTGTTRSYVLALGNIGEIHRRLNNPERAIYYLEQERILSDELDILTGRVQAYCELGAIYLEQGKLEKAFAYQLKVLDLINPGSPVWGSAANEILAKIHIIRKEYDLALECANECLRYAEMLDDPNLFVTAWNLFATIYLEQKHYEKAEDYAMKAWEMDSVSVDTGPAITLNIAQANTHLGNKEKATKFLSKNAEFNKQRAERSLHETLLGMEIKYETEKKEMRISSLEKDKKFFIGLGVIAAILLIVLIFLFYIRHRLSQTKQILADQKVKQLEQEKQIIATQAALDGETAERSRLAKDLHDGLGGMLSVLRLNMDDTDNLPNAREILDQSITELRRIAHHLMPKALLNEGLKTSLEDLCIFVPNAKFHYFGEDKRIDQRIETLIYRCAYELVNNAIKHSKASLINIQLIQEENRISLTVQDNGTGFEPKLPHNGMGLGNIRTRVIACNGEMNIYSSPEKGSEIRIDIAFNPE